LFIGVSGRKGLDPFQFYVRESFPNPSGIRIIGSAYAALQDKLSVSFDMNVHGNVLDFHGLGSAPANKAQAER
jgi:hypothetical protein